MRFRLIVLALAALACLYAVVPDVLAQVLPGQLVTVGCGKVVSCEPLNVTGLNTPTPLPTCPAGQLLVGPGEPGSTCGTPQPTSTPRPTDTPIPADTPRPTDTPIPPVNTATREAQGFALSTATPATGCIEAAVSTAQIDCVAPSTAITPAPTSTPRATDTPIPAVPTETPQATPTPELYLQATTSTPGPSTYLFYAGTPGPAIWVTPVPPTPRPTDTPIPAVNTATPIPAPTLAPTFAVGIIAEGNGGQGLQAGVAALTTATPIAAGFLYDSAGGAGSVLSFVTAVPTATIIATATPRATDTPIPTPTAVGGNPAGVYTVLMQSVTGTSVSTTKLFPGWGLNTLTSTESAHQAPMPLSLHVGQLCVTTTTTETTGLMSYDIRSNGSPLTTGTMIANGSVAGNYCVSISTTGFTQGQLLSIGLVNSTGTGATVSSVSVGLSYP